MGTWSSSKFFSHKFTHCPDLRSLSSGNSIVRAAFARLTFWRPPGTKFLEKHLSFTSGATNSSLTLLRLVKVRGSIRLGYPAQGCFLSCVEADRLAVGCDGLGWEFGSEVAGATCYNTHGARGVQTGLRCWPEYPHGSVTSSHQLGQFGEVFLGPLALK